jgi:aminotransferase in exopolysaccharide biosynthesis
MIYLNFPDISEKEIQNVSDCVRSGWISSAGTYVNQFEQQVAEYVGAKYGIACMNGTAGLHIAQLLLGIDKEAHVLAPNVTFIATLNAISYSGAEPILVDVDPANWQMDLDLLDTWMEANTEWVQVEGKQWRVCGQTGKLIKAIMPVHVLGNMGNIDQLISLAQKYNLEIIEDSTEALGSFYKGRHAGTFGKIGVFSFNGNKIISTGGGGVIVTDDEVLAKRAKHLTTQAKTSAMDYIHDEIGYNYRLVNVLAAIGVAQMDRFEELLEKKRRMDISYRQELDGVGDIVFQEVAADVEANCWLFTFKTTQMRELLTYLNDNGIQSRPFWMPMNQLDMFKDKLYIQTNDQSAEIYNTCISIPSSAGITREEQDQVIAAIQEFYKN